MEFLLLGDAGTQLDVNASKRRVEDLAAQARARNVDVQSLEIQVSHLEKELAQVRLAAQGLTRFLIEKGVVEEAELADFVREVDAEDGLVDGQLRLDPKSRKKPGGLPGGVKPLLE